MAEAISITQLTAFQNYCREYKPEMLTLPTIGNDLLTKYGFGLQLGRDEIILSELRVTDVIQPWKSDWLPKAAGTILPRTLKLRKNEISLEEEPEKYRSTYIGLQMQNKVDSTTHPYERLFVERIMLTARQNVFYAIMNGVYNAAGTTSADMVDGLLKVIADEITADNISLVPTVANNLPYPNLIATGAITAVNALDKLRDFYRALPAPFRAINVSLFCSHQVADYYFDAYIAEHNGVAPMVDADNNMILEGSGGLCKIVRMSNMGTSQRIFITIPENIVIGADDEDSLAQMNLLIRQGNNPKKIQFFAEFSFGIQIAMLAGFFTNDQA
jgi:hypothetical protein